MENYPLKSFVVVHHRAKVVVKEDTFDGAFRHLNEQRITK